MCKPKPGPRCSGHMRIIFNKSKSEFNKARVDLLNAEKNEQRSIENGFDDVETRQNQVKVLRQLFHAKQEKFAENRRLYDSTPEGQTMLEKKIESATAKGDTQAVYSLSVRLEEGKMLRKEQYDAYHKFLAEGGSDEDVVPAELREMQGAGQGRREITNTQGLVGEIKIQPHLRAQAKDKGFDMAVIMSVLRKPERVTPVTQHPGQLRYCGKGVAVICDSNRAITCYPDGKPSKLRPDQKDALARNSQRVKRFENKKKPRD